MTSIASIKTFRNKLRFQISSEFTRHYYPEIKRGNKYIYLGVEDNRRNRNKAEAKLLDLIEDLEEGTFNPNSEEIYHIKQYPKGKEKINIPTLNELFAKYILYKSNIISSSTLYDHNRMKCKMETFHQNLSNIDLVIQSVDNTSYSVYVKNEILMYINLAIKWGIENEIIPYELSDNIKKIDRSIKNNKVFLKKNPPKKSNYLHGDRSSKKYFSEHNKQIIIDAFYKKYGDTSRAHLIEVGFGIGARTEELFALTWGDATYVDKNGEKVMKINIDKAYVSRTSSLGPTKTGCNRSFLLNKSMQCLLERIKPENAKDKDLIFPSPKGRYLDSRKLNSIWYGNQVDYDLKYDKEKRFHCELNTKSKKRYLHYGVVSLLAINNDILEYLPPYQMRATFVNLNLLAGVNPALIAKWTGHSTKTMFEHYESLTGMEERMPD
jgi:integrase